MLFNSYEFLFGFVPLTLLAYFLACRLSPWMARLVLIIASFAFYFWWSPAFTLLLMASITFNYICVLLIIRLEKRPRAQTAALAVGIVGNLSLLCYFKYLFSVLRMIGELGFITIPDLDGNMILPLGISFFTFTQIGYLIDSKIGAVESHDPFDFVLFVTFFPHLIAGPLLHHREMMPQFAEKSTYQLRLDNLAVGLSIFVLGLAKKVLIADQLSSVAGVTFGFPRDAHFFGAWFGVLCYSMQLYFDFSGYTDMAVGLARLFGIRFPANFDSPYKSSSIIAFWQRWHMTLTRYLNLYLYNPMALWVSRRRTGKGLPTNRGAMATPSGFFAMVLIPTFYTMGIAGVWHGAGLQFVVFGLLHASYLTLNQFARVFSIYPSRWVRMPASWVPPAKICWTFLAVCIAFVFFRSASLPDALALLRAMAGGNGFEFAVKTVPYINLPVFVPDIGAFIVRSKFVLLGIAMAIVWGLPNIQEVFAPFQPVLNKVVPAKPEFLQWRPSSGWAVVIGAIYAIALLFLDGTSEFLYFQF